MPLPHAVPHVTPAVPHATPAPPAHAAPAHPQPLPAQPPRAPAQPAALTQPSASPGSPLAQPSSPHPPAAHIARGSSIPARPVPPPAPKPGQIISGPRQPLPAGLGEIPKAPPLGCDSGRTASGGDPTIPAPSRSVVPRHLPLRELRAAAAPVGGGGPLRPPAKPNLAGQPAARPVVPPRPDMVARLSASADSRRARCLRVRECRAGPASPVPGRPIYTGPVRPGQPLMRRGPGRGPSGPAVRRGPAASAADVAACIRPRRCAPSPPRFRPIPDAAMQPNRERATDRRRDVEPGRGSFTSDGAARGGVSSRRPSIAKSPSPKASRCKELSEKLGVKANLVSSGWWKRKSSPPSTRRWT